jgi:hypothetical protein
MRTGLEHMTEEELINFTYMRNNPTPLEMELAKRLDRSQVWGPKHNDPRQLELDLE